MHASHAVLVDLSVPRVCAPVLNVCVIGLRLDRNVTQGYEAIGHDSVAGLQREGRRRRRERLIDRNRADDRKVDVLRPSHEKLPGSLI